MMRSRELVKKLDIVFSTPTTSSESSDLGDEREREAPTTQRLVNLPGELPPEVAGILGQFENDPELSAIADSYGIDLDVIQQALAGGFLDGLGSDDEDDDQGGLELPAVPKTPPPPPLPTTTTREMLLTRASVTYRQDGESLGRAELSNGQLVDIFAVRMDGGSRSNLDKMMGKLTVYLMSDLRHGSRQPIARVNVNGKTLDPDKPLAPVAYGTRGEKTWPWDDGIPLSISVAVANSSR